MTATPAPAGLIAALTKGTADVDGSGLSLIFIPIVVVICLAAWLIAVAYATSHPAWKHGPAAPQGTPTTPSPDARVPLPRTEISHPVRHPAGTRPLAAAGHVGQ